MVKRLTLANFYQIPKSSFLKRSALYLFLVDIIYIYYLIANYLNTQKVTQLFQQQLLKYEIDPSSISIEEQQDLVSRIIWSQYIIIGLYFIFHLFVYHQWTKEKKWSQMYLKFISWAGIVFVPIFILVEVLTEGKIGMLAYLVLVVPYLYLIIGQTRKAQSLLKR